VAWWLWHPLGVAVAILMTGHVRHYVVNNAAFWGATQILTVGIAWGVIMAIAITIASEAATTSTVIKVMLLVEGFFAVGYVGYAPSPEDRFMYNKAGQTATVGLVCYVVTCVIVVVVSRWTYVITMLTS